MNLPLGDFSNEQFLEQYWQKKPCLIRNAIADFKPQLNGDDLAGLEAQARRLKTSRKKLITL